MVLVNLYSCKISCSVKYNNYWHYSTYCHTVYNYEVFWLLWYQVRPQTNLSWNVINFFAYYLIWNLVHTFHCSFSFWRMIYNVGEVSLYLQVVSKYHLSIIQYTQRIYKIIKMQCVFNILPIFERLFMQKYTTCIISLFYTNQSHINSNVLRKSKTYSIKPIEHFNKH